MKDTKIIVVTHKDIAISVPEGYFPFVVGVDEEAPAIREKHPNYLTDYTDDNIAEKHPYYAELTGLYWLWKNDTSAIKGLLHYSRFLYSNNGLDSVLSAEEIEQTLENNDILIEKAVNIEVVYPLQTEGIEANLANNYGRHQCSLDVLVLYQMIERLYPDYCESFIAVLSLRKTYANNVMICKREIFDAYCEWAFHILFTIEKEKNLSAYTGWQERIMGYLGELLLDVFIDYHKLKIKEYPLYVTKYDAPIVRYSQNDREKVDLSEDELIKHIFQFGNATNLGWNTPPVENFRFMSDGTIGGHDHFNERYWEIRDNRLFLLNGDHLSTSNFPLSTYSGYLFGENFVGNVLYLYIKDFPFTQDR